MLSMFSKCLTHKVQIHQKLNFISNSVGPSDAASGSGAAHTHRKAHYTVQPSVWNNLQIYCTLCD